MKVIAKIHNDFPEKFGIPRQSGLVEALRACIIFEPEYRSVEALRGLEEFSHIWLLWEFSENVRDTWTPTVRPPRLGGNKRVGVFATRSPFRPNPIGLSCVELEGVELTSKDGPVLWIKGADLMDGTPIYDIKPYLPFADSHPQAKAGFAAEVYEKRLAVHFDDGLEEKISAEQREALCEILAQDPRPSYQNDPQRVYGMKYANFEIKFSVDGDELTVHEIEEDKRN